MDEFDINHLPEINDVQFQKIINRIFSSFKDETEDLSDFCSRTTNVELRKYQKFVAEYLKHYRGLLVYHKLGSGKTLTAIEVMNITALDTIIILPASLRGNFETFIKSNYTANKKIKFISYNASNFLLQTLNAAINESEKSISYAPNPFDGKLIIIDEAHIFFQNVISGSAKQASEVLKMMITATFNTKFLFLTGTPIVGDVFELAPLFNVLRGPMNKDGEPIMISRNNKHKNLIIKKGSHSEKTEYYAFPTDIDEFYELFVSETDNHIKNAAVFQDRIAGLVSFHPGINNIQVVPKDLGMEKIECPMGSIQWSSYLHYRKQELDFERKAKYATNEFKKMSYKKPARKAIGTYKTFTAQVCNFAFPSEIEKKYRELGELKKDIAETKWNLLIKYFTSAQILEMLPSLSTKLVMLLERVKSGNMKRFVFSRFKVVGTRILAKLLEELGWQQVKEPVMDSNWPDAKRFIVIDGDTKNIVGLVDTFNRKDNLYGNKCSLLIGTTVVSAGISLMAVREVHILEPQWRSIAIEQIIGRAIRTCSHNLLPIEEREVKSFIYITVAPSKAAKNVLDVDAGHTTDQILFRDAQNKSILFNSFLTAIKEVSVDCKFNTPDNELCRVCENKGIQLYPGDVRQHIISGSKCVFTKKKAHLIDIIIDRKKYKRDIDGNVFDESLKHIGFLIDNKFVPIDETF